MSNLVYLMSSLPSLTFGQEPPIPMREFLCDAKDQLSEKHFKMLEAVDMQRPNKKNNNSGPKRIAEVMDEFSHDLSEIRKAKTLKRQPRFKQFPKTVLPEDPLEREKRIMQYQWEELESIESGKTFTLTEVVIYKLKLQILHRMYSFNRERGIEVFKSVVNPPKSKEGALWQA